MNSVPAVHEDSHRRLVPLDPGYKLHDLYGGHGRLQLTHSSVEADVLLLYLTSEALQRCECFNESFGQLLDDSSLLLDGLCLVLAELHVPGNHGPHGDGAGGRIAGNGGW